MEKIKLNLKNPVMLYPQLAKILGGTKEAIYWQQLYYWSDKGNDPEGWIYKTKIEMEKETTLTRYQQDRIREKLEKMGAIKTILKKVNRIPILHFKLDVQLVKNLLMEKQTSCHSDSKKLTNDTYTENTTENTYVNEKNSLTKPPFSFKRKKEALKADNRRHLQIISLYWEYKNIIIENEEQYQALFKRELRPAKNLIGFSDMQILDVMEWLENKNDFKWTLESVFKYITEDLDNIEPIKKKKDYEIY